MPDTYQAALNAGSGAAYGTFNIGSGTPETGFLISIKNSTPFDITEAASPAIHRLIVVSDHEDTAVIATKQPYPAILRTIDVLVLVRQQNRTWSSSVVANSLAAL